MSAEIERTGYVDSDWSQWQSWPFAGDLTPKPLQEPAEESARGGLGGEDCFICDKIAAQDHAYVVWQDEHAILGVPAEPRALPFATFLMPRACSHDGP